MKLIIQIPCYNEEHTLPAVIKDLPRQLPGIDTIEYLVIDDGSSDKTIEIARQEGVDHVLSLGSNQGLATAFMAGIQKSLQLGADIIINTDGDNQYSGNSIADLVAPVLNGSADIVIGSRPIDSISHFSWLKKKLQRIGSRVVRTFSGTDIPDTTSGFRAYTASAAMNLQVFNKYTYTLETIIQAGHMNLRITHVPIGVNPKTRQSRLMSSIPNYIFHSSIIILRAYITYKPLRTFLYLSIPSGLGGPLICLYWSMFLRKGHIQLLQLGVTLILISFMLMMLGILADLISANRQLIQQTLFCARSQIYKQNQNEDDSE
jgi:glycosyltransferase involved in cell wall biosynthesis